jgi:hypothetical protein
MPNSPASPRLAIRLHDDAVRIGPLTIHFHRTLRLPDDGRSYPLPPSLGRFPLHRVADHAERVPESWRGDGGVFIPMHQREALWLGFDGRADDPVALKVAAGMRNALTGEAWDERIEAGRDQDYVVVPGQPWLDGFNCGTGVIRQFIAMPLGMGYTAEGQLSGEETFGGIQLVAFRAREGAIPPAPAWAEGVVCEALALPAPPAYSPSDGVVAASASHGRVQGPGAEMGLAAGGRMRQDIHPDEHGPDVWDTGRAGRLFVHIVDAGMYQQITGRPAPATPISAQTYADHGLPWFEEYSGAGDIAPSDALAGLRSVAEKDAEHGFTLQDDGSVEVPEHLVVKLPSRSFSDPVS